MAFRDLAFAADAGTPIPAYLAWKFHPILKHHKHHKTARFLVTPRVMIVIYRDTMVTVLPFTFDAYICILIWRLFGCLPEEHPEWGKLLE